MGKEQLQCEETLIKTEFFSLENKWLRISKSEVYKIINVMEKVKKE